jgi:hypothetical protein
MTYEVASDPNELISFKTQFNGPIDICSIMAFMYLILGLFDSVSNSLFQC